MFDKTLEKYPELEAVLNQLSGQVTDDEMRKMNYEVNVNNQSPEKVAQDYLESAGLIK